MVPGLEFSDILNYQKSSIRITAVWSPPAAFNPTVDWPDDSAYLDYQVGSAEAWIHIASFGNGSDGGLPSLLSRSVVGMEEKIKPDIYSKLLYIPLCAWILISRSRSSILFPHGALHMLACVCNQGMEEKVFYEIITDTWVCIDSLHNVLSAVSGTGCAQTYSIPQMASSWVF